jgi:hypothetical protein
VELVNAVREKAAMQKAALIKEDLEKWAFLKETGL